MPITLNIRARFFFAHTSIGNFFIGLKFFHIGRKILKLEKIFSILK